MWPTPCGGLSQCPSPVSCPQAASHGAKLLPLRSPDGHGLVDTCTWASIFLGDAGEYLMRETIIHASSGKHGRHGTMEGHKEGQRLSKAKGRST